MFHHQPHRLLMWHGHQLDATKKLSVNPSVLHDASSEEILIRRSFAIHDGESHYVRRTSSIHAGFSIEVIDNKPSRLSRATCTQPQP